MTVAQSRGTQVRREPALHGRMDDETAVNRSGLGGPSHMLQEMLGGDLMVGDQRLGLRWMIAHAIGHKLLHPGRRLRMHEHALLGGRVERASGEFAGALLMDRREAPEHDRVHRGTLPGTRRLRGLVRLHGLCGRMTGSAEVCSLLTPQPPTDLSLPAMLFSISLFGAGAS